MQHRAKNRGRGWAAVTTVAVVLPLLACAQQPPATPAAVPTSALVRLATAAGEPAGQAVLTAVPEGVEIVLNVEKLTPGQHGFHIHTNGNCGPGPDPSGKTIDFGAAGGHFDPESVGQHGHPNDMAAHAGDAPNLQAGADGKATLRFVSKQVTLRPGKTSVMGRALVVHADADDYKTNPAGNSGARVLCGLIQPARTDAVRG